MEKEIEINGKKVVVKEIKYKDLAALSDIEKSEAAKRMIQLSTGISDEEYDLLGMKEGISLQKLINEVNGLEDFQQPPKN